MTRFQTFLIHHKEARVDHCLFRSVILYLCGYIYLYICMCKLYIYAHMFVYIYENFLCVHSYIYMYKSQSFSCRNYFWEVNVIAKGVSQQFCFQLLFYCTWRLSSSPLVQQEKPGQEVCWSSCVALPKCLFVCLHMKGVTGYGRV